MKQNKWEETEVYPTFAIPVHYYHIALPNSSQCMQSLQYSEYL